MSSQRQSNGSLPKLTGKNFPEQAYLKAFPDVASAIKNGIFKNAYEHFVKSGRAELESGLRPNFLMLDHDQDTVAVFPDPANTNPSNSPLEYVPPEPPKFAPDELLCFIDELSDGSVSGWLQNRRKNSYPILDVWIDGEKTVSFVSDMPRPDVMVTYPGSLYVGFKFQIPRRFLNGKTRRLQIVPAGNRPVKLFFKDQHSVFLEFNAKWKQKFMSNIDGLSDGTVKGWVLLESGESNVMQGGAQVLVVYNGANIAQLRANLYRPDVGKIHAADPYCGFEFNPPPHLKLNGPQVFEFKLLPNGKEITGSPFTVEFLPNKYEKALETLNLSLDKLYADMTLIRREINSLLPKNQYTILDYNRWAKEYFRMLSSAAISHKPPSVRQSAKTGIAQQPLVSIICPTYQPKLTDFEQAVESVMQQTYKNWELVIVDDGSNDGSLSQYLLRLAEREKRIKVHVVEKNSGISAATNFALQQSSGEWIGFMDHDDLLVDVAVQLMVEAAIKSNALLLYSDEDKIDKVGTLSAPAFKPDWNYRLLLGVNYICHFLMVKKEMIAKVGGFDSRYDGAQDHDFLLRLSEMIQPDRICHVPEILYHWRITENSTASEISSKPYAIEAGISCVFAHLKRTGKKANVNNFRDSTLYKISWVNSASPKVDIVIPFKDNIETTRMCISRVTDLTQYSNFRIVLVDNWSTSQELEDFKSEMAQLENVTYLRIEETFNYSRLNNLAVSKSDADFYVFMNNDVFVKDPMWLRTLVNEALADESVAVVGGKFLYPNGSIQHGGVVLGIGGVAGHVHVGHPADDGGYGGRAYFTQELSAVTAACMLVKASVFKTLSGFDETALPIAFNDIDFCLRARAAGYRIIWTPDFVADHHESLSRGSDDRPETRERFFHETETMIERWGDLLKHDPFYSKHFDLDGRPFYDLSRPHAPCQNPQ